MVTLAVLAILATIAVPSFNNFFDNYRVRRAAETVSAFLVNAKSEALKRNQYVRTVLTGGGATWCLGMTLDELCDCSAGTCKLDNAERVVSNTPFKGVKLNGPVNQSYFKFETKRGTVSGAETVELEGANGSKLNVVVSPIGRVRLCSPSGSGNMGAYPTC